MITLPRFYALLDMVAFYVAMVNVIRKKTTTWPGTVAGALSAHCKQHFVSGAAELGESGWWKLAEMKPPIYYVGEYRINCFDKYVIEKTTAVW
jgi:hypothetical protein